jgi:ADYC domain
MTPCFAEATHSNTPYWADTHVNVRSPAWPWQRTVRYALLLSMLTTDFQAHAGVHFQGVHFQGTALHPGLQGQQLVVVHAQADGAPMRVEISSFRGDRVAVRVHGPAASEVRAAEIHPTALVNATWSATSCDDERGCQEITYRIASVVRDDSTNTMIEHADNGDVWLYEIEYAELGGPDDTDWSPVCGGDGGDTAGVFVDGLWHPDGSRDDEGYTFSCLHGVIAKCVRSWGYKPWKTLPSEEHGDVSLAALHQMCTRVARADYCGDGNAHTRDGTLIDIFDGYGFNVRDESMPFAAESGFDQDGARWVERPRWPTGEPMEDGWRFATCERPASDPTFADEPAWLEVWSDPLLGQEDE